jgi:hypothetical protein
VALRIAINAQVYPGMGGINTVLAGLIKALSNLEGDETYVIIGTPENREWLS